MRTVLILFAAVLVFPANGEGAPKPVPSSPYVGVVYRYADTMLQRGRDTYGPQKTGLLLSVLDRATFSPVNDRAVAIPASDQNLLRVLYVLSELSNKPAYRDAADAELKWLMQNAVARGGVLPPWDDGFAWDVVTDGPAARAGAAAEGPLRPWMLWDHCFDLAPEASKRLVLGLRPDSAPKSMSPRRTGFSVRAFAVAYRYTRDDAMLKAIEAALARLEAEQDAPATERLSAAIDCGGAAGDVPAPLAARLRAFAARQDQAFCTLAHDLNGKGGFAFGPANRAAGETDEGPTSLWQARPEGRSTAAVAMMCVSRYENTGNIRYRDLVHAAADAYRASSPPDGADPSPMMFGHAISLELAAWRSTARPEYLEHAVKLADLAVQKFWPDGPLPKAGSKAGIYDATTGAGTLALAFVELHLGILHITAVRCPPNTIDR
jgi:hypothetical protein